VARQRKRHFSPDRQIGECAAVTGSGKTLALLYFERGNAYDKSGNAYDEKGDRDRAIAVYDRPIADCGEAIRLDTKYELKLLGGSCEQGPRALKACPSKSKKLSFVAWIAAFGG
jgi:hypothetical protein